MFVTLFDTTMTALAALIVWKVPPYFVFLPWLTFAAMDGAFISSALTKVPSGAWFTLTLATLLAIVFLLWRFGKESQWRAEAEDRHSIAKFIDKDGEGLRLAGPGSGEQLSTIKGLGIFFDKAGLKTPLVFSQYISKFVCLPEVIIFFHMRPLEYPTVPAEERFVVSKIKYLPNCYRIVLRYGFMDEVITPDLASLIYRNLRNYVLREQAPRAVEKGLAAPELARLGPKYANEEDPAQDRQSEDDSVPIDLAQLQSAYEHRVLYILGKAELVVKGETTSWWRSMLLRTFLFLRDYSRSKMSNIKLPVDRLVELGFIKQIGDRPPK